jgi:hypothetical protein
VQSKMSRDLNTGQNIDVKIANRYLKMWDSSNICRTTVTRRLNSRNACYLSVQNLVSSHLLSKYIKIRFYRTIILPVVLYGCASSSVILKDEHRLRALGLLGMK